MARPPLPPQETTHLVEHMQASYARMHFSECVEKVVAGKVLRLTRHGREAVDLIPSRRSAAMHSALERAFQRCREKIVTLAASLTRPELKRAAELLDSLVRRLAAELCIQPEQVDIHPKGDEASVYFLSPGTSLGEGPTIFALLSVDTAGDVSLLLSNRQTGAMTSESIDATFFDPDKWARRIEDFLLGDDDTTQDGADS